MVSPVEMPCEAAFLHEGVFSRKRATHCGSPNDWDAFRLRPKASQSILIPQYARRGAWDEHLGAEHSNPQEPMLRRFLDAVERARAHTEP